MPPEKWTPEKWRERADEAISIAERATDHAVKATMYLVAYRYHDLACLAEEELEQQRQSAGD